MDWFLLVVVLPLILIPLVLLLGFAGCSTFGAEDPVIPPAPVATPTAPAAPSGLTALAKSPNEIELNWQDNSPGAAKFKINRQLNAPGGALVTLPTDYTAPPPSVVDGGLTPETSYTYTVRAFDPATSLTSGPSNTASATTPAVPAWQVAYNAPPTTDDIDRRGQCLVQRINAPALTTAGQQIRVTLRASPTASIALDRLYISESCSPEPGNMTPDAWDSPATGLKELRPGGVYVAKGAALTLDPVNFPVNPAKDLLIALDIGAAGLMRKLPIATQSAFSKPGTTEANIANRSAGYTLLPGVFLIEKIEVFPTPAPTPAITWQTTFTQALTTNIGNRSSGCIVQRINAAKLTSSGSKVRLTLRGGTGGPLAIRRIFISSAALAGEPGNPTPNPWDSALNIIEVHPGGASIPANTAVPLAPFDYTLDKTKDLIIAFDISEFAGEIRQAAVVGPVFYYRANTEEAGVSNRTAGYGVTNDQVCIVEKIEVNA